jgi:pimeloyl-ACP methyl ester carboxylesterase
MKLGVVITAAIAALIGLAAAWFGFTGPPMRGVTPPVSGIVGAISNAATDAERREFFAGSGARIVPFQILYPASEPGRGVRYVPNAEPVLAAIERNQGWLVGRALARIGTITAPWTEGARPRTNGPFPVVIYLPGVTGYMQMSSFQTAVLAADGFVVVTLDQPGNVAAVQLPGGRVIRGMSRDQAIEMVAPSYRPVSLPPKLAARLAPERSIVPYLAADVPLVIDRLSAINADPRHPLYGLLDLEAVGVMGVSLGAIVAAQACQNDRIKACLMMDAPVPTALANAGLRKPAVWLTRSAVDQRAERAASGGWPEEEIAAQAGSIARTVSNSREARAVTLNGLFHVDFTDLPEIQPLIGRIGLTGPTNTSQAHRAILEPTLDFFRTMRAARNHATQRN